MQIQSKDCQRKNHRRDDRSKVVVVHRGARDGYQVARALSEAGMLECLITDLYWPADRAWARGLARFLPASVRQMLMARYAARLPSRNVRFALPSGPISFALDKLPRVGFEQRRRAQRWNDAELGRQAGQRAKTSGAQLLSYSYYGFHAFSHDEKPGMLFQVHPHPASVRRILARELADHPDCSASLEKEWELSLPTEDFDRLTSESRMAAHILCASSFTRQTLIENGAPAERIDVIPYGVDLKRFAPLKRTSGTDGKGPLRLLFVGTINQRKGIKYLLEALRLLKTKQVELTVCGRVVDDLSLFKPFGSQVVVRPSVSIAELVEAYQAADVFAFPSLAEGFGQVLLEALASGLPLLSTTHTAAPDLIDEGIQGFVVEPCRPDLLAQRLEWLLTHRSQIRDMKYAARRRAEEFTWARFRQGVISSVNRFLVGQEQAGEALTHYV